MKLLKEFIIGHWPYAPFRGFSKVSLKEFIKKIILMLSSYIKIIITNKIFKRIYLNENIKRNYLKNIVKRKHLKYIVKRLI